MSEPRTVVPPSDLLTIQERFEPGDVSVSTFREHEVRYQFAGKYVSSKSVLDLASGNGVGTEYLMRTGAAMCIGIDCEASAVRYARQHYSGPNFVVSDALQTPLAAESIDVVVSFETIEHLPNPADFVAECHRVLKPGGLLICSTPNHLVCRWIVGPNPYHISEMTPRQFCALMSGFQQLEFYGQDFRVFPFMVAKQVCLRLLAIVGLRALVTRLFGSRDWFTSCSRKTFAAPSPSANNLPAFEHGWMRQPVYIVAVARKAS